MEMIKVLPNQDPVHSMIVDDVVAQRAIKEAITHKHPYYGRTRFMNREEILNEFRKLFNKLTIENYPISDNCSLLIVQSIDNKTNLTTIFKH